LRKIFSSFGWIWLVLVAVVGFVSFFLFFLLISKYGQPEVCFNLPLFYEARALRHSNQRIVLPTEAKLLHFLIFGKCAKGFVFMSATGTRTLTRTGTGSGAPAVPVSGPCVVA